MVAGDRRRWPIRRMNQDYCFSLPAKQPDQNEYFSANWKARGPPEPKNFPAVSSAWLKLGALIVLANPE